MDEPTPDTEDPRDVLWEESYRILYDSYFEQIVAERLLTRWFSIDLTSRLLVALTASGSAVTAWAVWQKPEMSWVWAAVAGIAAILSITHSVLAVAGRLKELNEDRTAYLTVRTGAETLRLKMRLDPGFSVPEVAAEINRLDKLYLAAASRYAVDLFRTKKFRLAAQADINKTLGAGRETV